MKAYFQELEILELAFERFMETPESILREEILETQRLLAADTASLPASEEHWLSGMIHTMTGWFRQKLGFEELPRVIPPDEERYIQLFAHHARCVENSRRHSGRDSHRARPFPEASGFLASPSLEREQQDVTAEPFGLAQKREMKRRGRRK